MKNKHLLGLKNYPGQDINTIIDTSFSFKEVLNRPIKKVPSLQGKTIVNLFFENSTRTRISFELAQKRLSADTVNFSASSSIIILLKRKSIEKANVIINALSGKEIDLEMMQIMYNFYENHCAKWGVNHGHVFNDGPKESGKRFCYNVVFIVMVVYIVSYSVLLFFQSTQRKQRDLLHQKFFNSELCCPK